ncbi:MAG: hypothetical protein V3T31_13640 [candidate division Zixibacteria bacterium]
MIIQDDFLPEEQFQAIVSEIVYNARFPWFYHGEIVDYQETSDFQFIHNVYAHRNGVVSPGLQVLRPILDILDPLALIRIKVNGIVKTDKIIEHTLHRDAGKITNPEWTTSIFYLNTNNGYTLFEDGTKVESVANRIATFPSNVLHTGTSSTDENMRVCVNFNYFENAK